MEKCPTEEIPRTDGAHVSLLRLGFTQQTPCPDSSRASPRSQPHPMQQQPQDMSRGGSRAVRTAWKIKDYYQELKTAKTGSPCLVSNLAIPDQKALQRQGSTRLIIALCIPRASLVPLITLSSRSWRAGCGMKARTMLDEWLVFPPQHF